MQFELNASMCRHMKPPMKLISKEIEKALLKNPLHSTENVKCEDKKVIVKYFTPYGSTAWLVCEAEQIVENNDWLFFGYVTLDGKKGELGYFLYSDLCDLGWLERDMYLKPFEQSIREMLK